VRASKADRRRGTARWREQERALERTAELLRTPVGDLEARALKLLEERKTLERELESLRAAQRSATSGDLASQAETIGGIAVLLAKVDGAGGDDLRAMVDELRSGAAESCCSRRRAKIASRSRSA
jgi:alanyl-tRNA synthetase